MRFRAEHLRPHGWRPPQTVQIPNWCGCSTEYLPVAVGDGWWQLVPIWEPDRTANPLRRWEPPVPCRPARATQGRRPDDAPPRWQGPEGRRP
jgi:hypothetical protein